jgi:hypothetical protein
MKEVLNTLVQAVGDQAIALGAVDDRVTALKRTLARQFPDLADELKGQIDSEQEQSRNRVYDLQVSLARVREAISQLSDAPAGKLAGDPASAVVEVERKRRVSKAPVSAAAGRSHRTR